ncbi:MAG: T9SS type A sorting domain-containing protein [Candidatus Zambryskibacteria bacterium]|nr:T9SS type A sorting domain-containing protein [Candidatus Zambryskibacteria bacterium]
MKLTELKTSIKNFWCRISKGIKITILVTVAATGFVASVITILSSQQVRLFFKRIAFIFWSWMTTKISLGITILIIIGFILIYIAFKKIFKKKYPDWWNYKADFFHIDSNSEYDWFFVWEYNPSQNTWTQKADFGGTARWAAVGFSIGDKGYLGTGWDGSYCKDFWEYDPSQNTWTQKADFGGGERAEAVGFSINNKGYIGTGYNYNTYGYGRHKDFWEYDPLTDAWSQRADFGGTTRIRAVGFSIGDRGYIGLGTDPSYRDDFWEYNPSQNAWTQVDSFAGTARSYAVAFSVGGKGYIGTGWDGSYRKDFWEYDTANSFVVEPYVTDAYILYQNYPNPFYLSTAIRFAIKEKSHVKLTIFNTIGQTVATLVDEKLPAGYYESRWDATLSSGIYFYRLEAISDNNPSLKFIEAKKMILLR